jgi:hypothetical protein
MFTIDILLKMTPMPVSVQRKEAEGAETLYKTITDAMQGQTPTLLELTCEKQADKKVAVFSNQIIAVIVSEKSGTTATGRPPGFLSVSDN